MMPPNLTSEEFERLRGLGTPRVANAIERFRIRLRNEGYGDGSIHCLFPELGPMLGYAATLKVRSVNPPTEREHYLEHTQWWDHVLAVPAPRLLVIEDLDAPMPGGAFLGEVHASILQALHCLGALTNGAVRDLPEVRAAKFHFFAGCVSVSHAYVHIVEVGQGVTVAGLRISPGDLIHADGHGVVSVPLAVAPEIPRVSAQIEEEEQRIIGLCRSDNFSVERLRDLVREIRK